MPNNSGLCEKVCVLLLLLERLRRLRPDLKPVEQGNLLSLVGGRRRKPSRAAQELFKQARQQAKGVTDPLELVALGLAELEGFAPLVGPEDTVKEAAAKGIVIQPTDRKPPATVAQIQRFIAAVPRPVGPIPPPSPRRLAKEQIQQIFGNEDVREVACGVVSPLLLRGLTSGVPLIAGGSIAALALCGFEFAEDV